ncbi:hypothetical protein D3C76_1857240 [compost metagenome]
MRDPLEQLTEHFESLTYVRCEWIKELPGLSNPKVGTVQEIDSEGARKLCKDGYVMLLD